MCPRRQARIYRRHHQRRARTEDPELRAMQDAVIYHTRLNPWAPGTPEAAIYERTFVKALANIQSTEAHEEQGAAAGAAFAAFLQAATSFT